jgi:hypothetical protein
MKFYAHSPHVLMLCVLLNTGMTFLHKNVIKAENKYLI